MMNTLSFGTRRRQHGATLLISLIMLVVLTLFAVAGFNLSSVNLKVAGNFQAQRAMEAAAQQAIETVLTSLSNFYNAPPVVLAPQTITVSGFNVAVTAATCNYARRAAGFSKDEEALAPQDTDWEVRATVTDALTGAQATITQGVLITLPKDNCL
jgi:hypothetical protein